MPRFKASAHTLSPKDQIINFSESLFFIKNLGHFRPFYGVTESTSLVEQKHGPRTAHVLVLYTTGSY